MLLGSLLKWQGLLVVLFMREKGERFHFWQRVKIKNVLLSGPLSESSPAAWSTPGTRAQHMSDLPLKRV